MEGAQRQHHKLTPENETIGWNLYPRPQCRRNSFMSLNGYWEANKQKVFVPFPLQSDLSGYQGDVPENIIYERTFALSEELKMQLQKKDMRLQLHFGAVDQIAKVACNGTVVGIHEGGYLPFSFDVTECILPEEENTLVVYVKDELSVLYPYGKQSKHPKGMWYTPVSGIWQSVWLECVPVNGIAKLNLIADMEQLRIQLWGLRDEGEIHVTIYEPQIHKENKLCKNNILHEGNLATQFIDEKSTSHQYNNDMTADEKHRGDRKYCQAEILFQNKDEIKLWSPEKPFLYPITITTKNDEVESYFALRKIEIKEVNGIQRVCLNEKPIFLHGVLDQGYFCDGIFLPANEEQYERDILRMKELGFNMLRKHIKIEPQAFYFACDRLGMLVVQDMVNNGEYHFLSQTALPTIGMTHQSDRMRLDEQHRKMKQIFEKHMVETIKYLQNHPCIVMYTIFNEGWGQVCSDKMYQLAKSIDDTRLYDTTSGWFAKKKSDVDSLHIYFRNKKLKPKRRPMFLSECGGFSYKVKDHFYSMENDYGYGTYQDEASLTDGIINMYQIMVLPAIKKGLCGCVYTQLSDVEDEINGFYTYDRCVCKVEKEKLQKLAQEIDDIMKHLVEES